MLIVLEEMLMLLHPFSVEAAAPELTSPSVVLMEASTGTVIYEKAGNEQRSPASITNSNFPQGFFHVTRNKYGISCN